MKKIYNKTYLKLNQIFEYIINFNERNGYCPSLRQIGSELRLVPSVVKYYLDILEESGKIIRSNSTRRVITLPAHSVVDDKNLLDTTDMSGVFNCPIVGSVAAGVPILATENITGYYPLPRSEYNFSSVFMLKIVGDSMIDAGIFEGDIIIVDKEKEPVNSKIVVALIDDFATVKRFLKKSNSVVLHPENSSYEDIILTENDNFSILGVVVGLIKKF